MNKNRRKRVDAIRERLVELQEEALELKEVIDALHEEETEAQDNIPEAFIDRFEKSVSALTSIEELQSYMDEVDTAFSAAIDEAGGIVAGDTP